jgi:HPt (histidine-containing phosphotransfer) domain-containing protein
VSSDEKKVSLIREYAIPTFASQDTKSDIERVNLVELQYLQNQVRAQNDRIRRLREEIESQIRMLTAALCENKQETYDEVKRRLSRLKGALEYRGRVD